MPLGDQTGPKGEGPLTGRKLGYGAGYNSPGYVKDDCRPYDGRGQGQGNRPLRNSRNNIGLEAEVRGPGGHIPDGTGPHGRGMGPGQGRADGSGLELLASKRDILLESIASESNSKALNNEYNSLHQKYGFSADSQAAVKKAHDEAVTKGYKGSKRRAYVNKKMAEYSENKKSDNGSNNKKSKESSKSTKNKKSSKTKGKK